MLHHAPNRLSCRDNYDGIWKKITRLVVDTRNLNEKSLFRRKTRTKVWGGVDTCCLACRSFSAIMAQRPGMKQFLAESEGIQGYEVLINDESITSEAELVLNEPGMTQSYSFVPVIAGSKSKLMTMVLGVTLIAVTGGFGVLWFLHLWEQLQWQEQQ